MTGKAKLLICDDSDTILDVLCAFLSLHYDTIPARTGQECLQKARSFPIDLILLDVQMANMDGFETCKHLKSSAKTSDIPVIFMTASQVRSRVLGFECGGVDFVNKPSDAEDFAEIVARINTHLTIRQQRQQLIVQEKLASLGELTAGISHEIKNPLNFVVNFSQVVIDCIADLKTELAKSENERDPEELEYILSELPAVAQDIKENGERAVRIIHGMLEHSRGERGKRQKTNINLLVDEYTKLAFHGMRGHDSTFNADIQTQFDPQLDSQRISIVPQDICRVILNITTNGFQAVQCKYERLERMNGYRPLLFVSTHNRSNDVRIKIRDNGTGIPLEHREKIFEPFFTTKPNGEGTGLGLSMAYEIITQEHGGELRCDSKEGEWTEFEIILPKQELRSAEAKL